jgi:sugar phosphate isomerase/epimerase
MSARQPLAVQLYSFREALAADRPATLAKTAALGFQAVEPFGIGDPNVDPATRVENAKAFRKDLDAAGLKVCSTHGYAPLGANADAVLDELDALGTDVLIAPSPGLFPGLADTDWQSHDQVKRFAEAVNTAAENAARRGKRFGFHNHWSELALQPDGTTGLERMYSFAADNVIAEVDLYWVNVGGANPAEIVSSIGDRVGLVHAKDGAGTPEQKMPMVALGEGAVDNEGAIAAGTKIDWHIIELDVCATDVFEAARKGAQRLVDHGYSRFDI